MKLETQSENKKMKGKEVREKKEERLKRIKEW